MLEDEKINEKSLAAQSPQKMTIRASLITRGLCEISQHLSNRRRRILVVNDRESFRQNICEVLELAGYECKSVAGGPEALALLGSKDAFDLLIHDLLNPHLDGFSLLQQAKKQFPDLPIIVATAIDDNSVADACMQNGAYAYLRVPLDLEELFTTVSRALMGAGRSA